MTSFRNRLYLIFFLVFFTMTTATMFIIYRESETITNRISKEFASLYAVEVVGEMNTAIQREIALSQKSANTLAILDWFTDEFNQDKKSTAISEINQFNTLYKDHNTFVVVDASKNYYYIGIDDTIETSVPRGHLSEAFYDDLWYFKALDYESPYMLNVDVDRFLGTMRVWINTKVYDKGHVIGVIGTGLYLDPIIDNIFGNSDSLSGKAVIINEHGAIQLDTDRSKILQNSFEPNPSIEQTIFRYADASAHQDEILSYLNAPDKPLVLTLHQGEYDFIVITPIKDTSWHVATFFTSQAIFNFQNFTPMIIGVIFVFIPLALLLAWIIHRIAVRPLESLNNSLLNQSVEFDFEVYGTARKDEFGSLAKNIQIMKNQLNDYSRNLEHEIGTRTRDLESAYTQIAINEKRLHRLFTSIPVGIFILDRGKNYVYGNPFFISQFGYDSESEFTHQLNTDFKQFFASEVHYQAYCDLITGKNHTLSIEVELLRGDRTTFWAEIYLNEAVNETADWAYEGILINIQNTKDYEDKLLNMAVTDRLTSLYNRHHFDHVVKDELSRHSRYGGSLSLIAFDLDHFKQINDTWGHPMGDEVLKSVAATVKVILRHTDTLARWGGEEFVILLPNTSLEQAMGVAEKIRSRIESLEFPREIHVTSSFGVAERQLDEEYNTWFRRADSALYEAKRQGRNQVAPSKF